MQSLDLIKKRIKSVEATRKITNAMKLVATTKIKAQLKKYEATSHFCHEYYSLFKTLVCDAQNLDFIRLEPCKNHKTLYIVISSELGLCGPYNASVCKHLAAEIKPEDQIIVYGQKGINWLNAHNLGKQIIKKRHWNASSDSYYTLLPSCYDIVEEFEIGTFETVKLVATKFESSVKYTPKTWTVLPLSPEIFGVTTKNDVELNSTIFEPGSKEILRSILSIYVSNFVYGALVEASLCESSSRRFAMEGATKNADELIDSLKIQYNQARQESITREINEIVAGSIGKTK